MYKLTQCEMPNGTPCTVLTYGNGNYESTLYMENLERLCKRDLNALFKNIKGMITDKQWKELEGHVHGVNAKAAYDKAEGKGNAHMKQVDVLAYDKGLELIKTKGYEFKAPIGEVFQVYKSPNSKKWVILDPRSGLSLGCDGATRQEAMNNAETRGMYEKYAEHVANRKEYKEQVARFSKAMQTYEVVTGVFDGKKVARKEGGKPMKKQPEKQPMKDANADTPEKWQGVTVKQKNAKSCIWVSGKTAKHKEQLMKMGYTYSQKKQAWWKHPEGWAA